MFITADIFLKVGGHNWAFTDDDISTCGPDGNYACNTFGPDGTCNNCPLQIDLPDGDQYCATIFDQNPDLQASIDAFKLSHPEFFI